MRLLEAARSGSISTIPVAVRKGPNDTYEILSQPELVHAARRARIASLEVKVIDTLEEIDVITIVEDNYSRERTRPDPIAEALAFQTRLHSCKEHSHRPLTLLSDLTGHSPSYLSNAMRLLSLPPNVQQLVSARKLGVRHARALLRLPTARAQSALANTVVTQGLSAQATEDLVKKRLHTGALDTHVSERRDPDILALEHELTEIFGATTTLDEDNARFTVHYHNIDCLQGILAKVRAAAPPHQSLPLEPPDF